MPSKTKHEGMADCADISVELFHAVQENNTSKVSEIMRKENSKWDDAPNKLNVAHTSFSAENSLVQDAIKLRDALFQAAKLGSINVINKILTDGNRCYEEQLSILKNTHSAVSEIKVEQNGVERCGSSTGNFDSEEPLLNGEMVVFNQPLTPAPMVNLQDGAGRSPLYVAVSNGHIEAARCLIKHGSRINLRTNTGLEKSRCPIHAAACSGTRELVALLLDHGASINIQDEDGQTPLHLAAVTGHQETTQLLIQRNACVDIQDKNGRTPLNLCLNPQINPDKVHVEIAKEFAAVCDVNIADEKGVLPLHNATLGNFWDLIDSIIKHGADVNATDSSGRTSLHYAFMAHKPISSEAAQTLLRHGGNLSVKDDDGVTPLQLLGYHDQQQTPVIERLVRTWAKVHVKDDFGKSLMQLAVLGGSTDIISFLIENGVDINQQDQSGYTALHLASLSGKQPIVDLLMSHGAAIDLQNDQGQSALHHASLLPDTTTAKFLIDKDADVCLKDEYGMTPLHKASGWGSSAMVDLLIDKGARVNEFENKGQRPLHLASEEGKTDIVVSLIKKGSKVSIQDKDGRTPLHLAAKNGHVETVTTLLDHSADQNLQDRNGQSPLHVACFYGKTDVVTVLISRGADTNLCDQSGSKPEDVAVELGSSDVLNVIEDHKKRRAENPMESELSKTSSSEIGRNSLPRQTTNGSSEKNRVKSPPVIKVEPQLDGITIEEPLTEAGDPSSKSETAPQERKEDETIPERPKKKGIKACCNVM